MMQAVERRTFTLMQWRLCSFGCSVVTGQSRRGFLVF